MNKPVSNCCGAPVRVDGDVTMYHVCEKCEQACDVKWSQSLSTMLKSVTLSFVVLLGSAICSFAQRGTVSIPTSTTITSPLGLISIPTFKQTVLTWSNDVAGVSNRVSWGLARNAWTNGSRVVLTNAFFVTNGWHYKITSMLTGIEVATPALWPSNRLGGDLWLVGYGTNMTNPTNIVKLLSYQGNNPPGNMQFWGVVDLTTGWE